MLVRTFMHITRYTVAFLQYTILSCTYMSHVWAYIRRVYMYTLQISGKRVPRMSVYIM